MKPTLSVQNASCLIRTRVYRIGFPDMFNYYPEGMPEDLRVKLSRMARDAMGNDLRSAGQDVDGIRRRVIVSEQDYLILGACGLLTDFMDEAGRPSYGFFAFVWRKTLSPSYPHDGFPNVASFRFLVKDLIARHWSSPGPECDGVYMDASWKRRVSVEGGIPVGFDLPVTLDRAPDALSDDIAHWKSEMNHDHDIIQIFSHQDAVPLASAAVRDAARTRSFSMCTNLEIESGKSSLFMNATSREFSKGERLTNLNRSAADGKAGTETGGAPKLDALEERKTVENTRSGGAASNAIFYKFNLMIEVKGNMRYGANQVRDYFEKRLKDRLREPGKDSRFSVRVLKEPENAFDWAKEHLKGEIRGRRTIPYRVEADRASTNDLRTYFNERFHQTRKETVEYYKKRGCDVTIKMIRRTKPADVKSDNGGTGSRDKDANTNSNLNLNLNLNLNSGSNSAVNLNDIFGQSASKPASDFKSEDVFKNY